MFSLAEIKLQNSDAGYYFFSKGALSFFKCKVSSEVFEGIDGIFFVTSDAPSGSERRYTVRRFDSETCKVTTFSRFQEFATLNEAKKCAKDAAD